MKSFLTFALGAALGYAVKGTGSEDADALAVDTGAKPAINDGDVVDGVQVVLLDDSARTQDVARANARKLNAALQKGNVLALSRTGYAVIDREPVTGEKTYTVPTDTYHAGSTFVLADRPIITVPKTSRLQLGCILLTYFDNVVAIRNYGMVFGHSSDLANGRAGVSCLRTLDVVGPWIFNEESLKADYDEIKLKFKGWAAPLDKDGTFAWKGYTNTGFDTTSGNQIDGRSIDSYQNGEVDTTNLAYGGYDKKFPQMDAKGKYTGSTADKWGFHNGMLSQQTPLIEMFGEASSPAVLQNVFVGGSMGSAVHVGRPQTSPSGKIVAHAVITGCRLAHCYGGAIGVACTKGYVGSNNVIHNFGHPDVVRMPGGDGYCNPGYGYFTPRTGPQECIVLNSEKVTGCRRNAYDMHYAAHGVAQNCEFRGLQYGIKVGVTEGHVRASTGVDDDYLKYASFRFSNCQIEGMYGIECDNGDTFIDSEGQTQYHVFLDSCTIEAQWAVKNIYPRAVIRANDLVLRRKTSNLYKDGNPSGLWVGSVNTQRGTQASPFRITVAEITGFQRAVVVEDATQLDVYAPTVPAANAVINSTSSARVGVKIALQDESWNIPMVWPFGITETASVATPETASFKNKYGTVALDTAVTSKIKEMTRLPTHVKITKKDSSGVDVEFGDWYDTTNLTLIREPASGAQAVVGTLPTNYASLKNGKTLRSQIAADKLQVPVILHAARTLGLTSGVYLVQTPGSKIAFVEKKE